jgi:hypothetical protein
MTISRSNWPGIIAVSGRPSLYKCDRAKRQESDVTGPIQERDWKYLCSCGHQLDLSENTVSELKQKS